MNRISREILNFVVIKTVFNTYCRASVIMTEWNNPLYGRNAAPVDAYIRQIGDIATQLEVALLPIIDYFVANTEHATGSVVLPGTKWGISAKFLTNLSKRYHKREFEFIAQPDKSGMIFDYISDLVQKTSKLEQYVIADCLDLLSEYPAMTSANFPHHVLVRLKETAELFHKFLKIKSEHQMKENVSSDKIPAYTQTQSFASPFHLYQETVSEVVRVADNALLQLYDYILESRKEVIKNDKLASVWKDISKLAESHYSKIAATTHIEPATKYISTGRKNGKASTEAYANPIMDAWSSDAARLLEFRAQQVSDFKSYLDAHATKKERRVFDISKPSIIVGAL